MSAQLKLYGRKTSANVQKPMWLLGELGVPYEQIEVGGKFGGLDTDDYGAMNPNRLVPTFVDDDVTLWESSAITRYIAARYGDGRMWIDDPVRRALADQWIDWANVAFQPAWLGVFVHAARTKVEHRDPEKIRAAVAQAERHFAMMNDTLATRDWLAGETFSIADIVCGVAMHRWTTMDIERQSFGHVDAWHQRLRTRPAFVETVCTPYDDLVNVFVP